MRTGVVLSGGRWHSLSSPTVKYDHQRRTSLEFLPTNAPQALGCHAAYNIAAMACRHYLFYRFGPPFLWDKHTALRTFQQRFPSDIDADWAGQLAADETKADGERSVRLWHRLHRWLGEQNG